MNQVDKEQLKKELEKWEEALYINSQIDRFSEEDRKYDIKCREEIRRIKEILGDDNLSD